MEENDKNQFNNQIMMPNIPPNIVGVTPPENNSGCIGIKTSTLAVAAVEIVFIGSILALYLSFYVEMTSPPPVLIAGLVTGLILGFVAFCFVLALIVGVLTSRPLLIQAHLGVQIISICVMASIGALTVLLHSVKFRFNPELGVGFPAAFLSIGILCLVMAIAEVWFFFIVRDCYSQIESRESLPNPYDSSHLWWQYYMQMQQQQNQYKQHASNDFQCTQANYAIHCQTYAQPDEKRRPNDDEIVRIDEVRELNITTVSA